LELVILPIKMGNGWSSLLRHNGMEIRHFWVLYWRRFFSSHCTRMAASLAYSTLLTLVPLLIILFAILALFPWFHGVGQAVQQFVLKTFIPSYAQEISHQINTFVANMKQLSWYRLIFFFVVSILMIYNLVNTFNRIWETSIRRHVTSSFLWYAIVVLVSPVVLGILFFIGPYLNALLVDFEHVTHWSIEKPIILALPYGVSWATFVGFNWLIPNARVPFRCAFWAGTLTAVLFELAKIAFAAYVSHVSYYHVLYGALSVIPLFLIWLYVSWLIILGGAIFCCLLTENQ